MDRLVLGLLGFWLCVVLSATATHAREMVVGLDQRLDFETNIFKSAFQPVRDALYVVSPQLVLREQGEALNYDLRYAPSLYTYFRTGLLDGWNQDLRGDLEYQIDAVNSISLDADVHRSRSATQGTVDDLLGRPAVFGSAIGTVTRFAFGAAYDRSFSSTTRGTARLSYDAYRYSDSINNQGTSGSYRLQSALGARSIAGLDLSGAYRIYQEKSGRPAVQTASLNSAVVFEYQVSPSVKATVVAGPALVYTLQDAGSGVTTNRYSWGVDSQGTVVAAILDSSCAMINGQVDLRSCRTFLPTQTALGDQVFEIVTADFDPGQNPTALRGSDLTYFGSATLSKEFQTAMLTANYERAEDASSGSGSAVIRDSVTLRGTWTPEREWILSASGNWTRRRSLTSGTENRVRAGPGAPTGTGEFFAEANGLIPQVVEGKTDITQFWAEGSVGRSLSANLRLRVTFRYIRQEARNSLTPTTTFMDDYIASMSVRYDFDAFVF